MAWWEKVADFWWGEGWEEWLVPFALSLSRKTNNMSSNKLISDHHRGPFSVQVLLFHLLFNHDRAACYGGWLGTFASSSPTITGSTPTVTRIAKEEVKSNGSRLAGVFSRLLARLNYDEEEMMEKMGGCRLYRWVFTTQASSLTISSNI